MASWLQNGEWLGRFVRGARSWFGILCLPTCLLSGEADRSWNERAVERLQTPTLGLPPAPVPATRTVTPERVGLGRKLFFDRRLSVNGTMSCGMCHIPEQGFTNNELARPIGVGGRSLKRNAPTLLNVAYARFLFHDGRSSSLEDQVTAPLIAPNEMGNPSTESVVERVRSLSDYKGMFEAAFGAGPDIDGIAAAIAAWERTLIAGGSPFDRWRYAGDGSALSREQIQGFDLFNGKAGCARCHRIGNEHALFTDHEFHNTGVRFRSVQREESDVPVSVQIAPGRFVQVGRNTVRSVGESPLPDSGRMEATENPADLRKFRTPSLRNVALGAPYMHDGSMATLAEVVAYYDQGGADDPNLDSRIRPLNLSRDEMEALVVFLRSLTSPDCETLIRDARSAESASQ